MRNYAIHGGFTGLAASTRVRLARNVKGYPYRNLTPGQLTEIANKVWDALSAAPAVANGLHMTDVRAGSQEAMQLIEGAAQCERSKWWISWPGSGYAARLSSDRDRK